MEELCYCSQSEKENEDEEDTCGADLRQLNTREETLQVDHLCR